ncbi:MAG: VanZ family protein [Ruminococcaceae bacterium]|nr:VanZ family protein [Oscillospiraceae bacterium]
MARKIFSWVAVILWMLVIFGFSAQSADSSDTLSMGLSEKIVEFILSLRDIPVFSALDGDAVSNFILNANHYVRKTAHFMIFAVLGLLVNNLLLSYGNERVKSCFFAVLICFLYAVSDEVHQYFVPGRACRLKDVIIDTCGASAAVCLAYLTYRIRRRYIHTK